MDYGMDKKKKKNMVYGGMNRTPKKHGGPHNNDDRIGMAIGGAMETLKPN
jgi:hypothetical protein